MFNTSLNNGESEKVGSIKAFGGSVAPFGWLICDGSAISRTLYAELFAIIGTTYGAGDGSTTFNLPNGKIPVCGKIPVYSIKPTGTEDTYLRMGSLPAASQSFRGFRWESDSDGNQCLQAYRKNYQDDATDTSIPTFHFEGSVYDADPVSVAIIKY